jgi:hypothetical protein
MPQSLVFVLEVDGAAVLAFMARGHKEASELRRESWLQDELKLFKHSGRPIWDGKTKLTVRRANPDEISVFEDTLAQARRDGLDESDGECFIGYLIPVVRPPAN